MVFNRHFSSVDLSTGIFYYDQLVGWLGHSLKISNEVLENKDQVEIAT